jgi:hypothetical protein
MIAWPMAKAVKTLTLMLMPTLTLMLMLTLTLMLTLMLMLMLMPTLMLMLTLTLIPAGWYALDRCAMPATTPRATDHQRGCRSSSKVSPMALLSSLV